MAEQPQRPNPPDSGVCPPPGPLSPEALDGAGSEALLDGSAPPSDDTPTIITKVQTRPNTQEHFFSGILRGRKLAHFELIEPIGVGGMAAVLRARDTQLDRLVALKILPPEMAADPENVARFHQEARAAARLDHETIARVFFCGEDQSLHFIAFEFVEGENLRTLIDRRGPLPVQEALHYMLQVATGLAHASERGVVHRDIKPSNIIISPNGRAKLVDMGLARNLGPQTDHGLTQSGVTLGTFDYISPEQALEPRDADVRSDIYSLGCTFYHVVTGQAPVPEGTAARKLHHHQHVPPIDPRQLSPDIPDEVAAILGRMMAKDPRQRYQRPEHLVQHLLQATHRLGGQPEAADGVLFVDAALPAPPRTRPLLVVGCAAAIVVALVVLVGPSRDIRGPIGLGNHEADRSSTEQPGEGQPPRGDPQAENPSKPATKIEQPIVENEKLTSEKFYSWQALQQFAATSMPDKSYELIIMRDLEPQPQDLDIVLHGKAITLKGGETGRPLLWSPYVADIGRVGGLIVEADRVEVKNLRIVANNNNSNSPNANQLAAGVVFRGAQTIDVSDCEFLQGSGEGRSSYSSVAIDSVKPDATKARFQRCAFLAGKTVQRPSSDSEGWLPDVGAGQPTAVALQGPAEIQATNCAFGPHAILFRFEGKKPGSSLDVRQCTALAGDEWSLASLGTGTPAAVQATNCLFARVVPPPDAGMMMMAERRPTACLVRHSLDAPPAYQGLHNRFQNIDAVLLRANDEGGVVSFADLPATSDDKVLPAAVPIFEKKDPLLLLRGRLSGEELRAAFRLDFSNVPGLLVDTANPVYAVVGVYRGPWEKPEWDENEWRRAVASNATAKIVDPTKETDTANRIYKSLAEALAAPKSGDIIKIHHNGELKIGAPLELKNDVSVTILADGDMHPRLMLADDTRGPSAALFQVKGGQLTLEGLEFRLLPNAAGNEARAVALLFGDGSVQFKGCVLTLVAPEDRSGPLAAVALADLKEGMMMPPVGPKVVFDNSFIRGVGDLVSAHASRPFDLKVEESLVAVSGSLLNIDTTLAKEVPVAASMKEKEITVRLENVTAYLGEHLVRLHAARVDNLLPVRCTPVKSLLVSARNREKALLHLEAGTKELDAARLRFPWSGESNNYANFSTMLDQQSGDTEMAKSAGSPSWQASDNGSKSLEVTFDKPEDLSLTEVLPSNFVVKNGPKDYGVSRPLPALLQAP
jgi:serine/threonine protein kinase